VLNFVCGLDDATFQPFGNGNITDVKPTKSNIEYCH
jgi:hypothetical protein